MGSGRGSGRSSMESLKRAGRTVFFLVNMLGSLFVSSGPILVSILDICTVVSAFTCCSSCFSFKADWATYSFRSSLVDIPLLSLGRCLAALCAYAVCGIPSLCHGPYLGITIISGIGTTVLLSVKASLYENFYASSGAPMSVGERRHKIGLVLLLVSSAIFALMHIFVAFKARCRARRKLCFDRTDMDGVLSSKISMKGYQRVSRASSPRFLRRNDLESNMVGKPQQEEDNNLPARLFADQDSLFVDVKGLLVHYKSTDSGSAFSQIPLRDTHERYELSQYTRNLSSKSSPNLSTSWNPLIRPSITGSLHSSVRTPLLSGSSGENNVSTFGSSSWGSTAPAFNGWPAIAANS